MSSTDPLFDPAPVEVPLKDAPLVRVIAQVRFPEVLAIEDRSFVSPFQEALRATYPVLRQEQSQNFVLGPGGLGVGKSQPAWRFADVAGHWRVSLTSVFLALETTRYSSRSDFLARLGAVLEALDEHVEPKLVDRLGVRYIDRITGSAVDEIKSLVRDEVRGINGTSIGSRASHALSESMFELEHEGAKMLARWGRLPPGATVDPAAIEPATEKSWILDLDMFSAEPIPFGVDDVINRSKQFAERIYAVFRWAVTDDFLRRYGGSP